MLSGQGERWINQHGGASSEIFIEYPSNKDRLKQPALYVNTDRETKTCMSSAWTNNTS